MRVAQPERISTAGPVLAPVDAAARARVSGPGLRAFRAIATEWGLSERERLALLGEPARSTYHQWIRKAEAEEAPTLPLDTLLRISGVLGVYKALEILFPKRDEAAAWLKGPHRGPSFGGQSPLAVMVGGGPEGIFLVRRHLDAWRGGLREGPGPDLDVAPVRPEDLVFV